MDVPNYFDVRKPCQKKYSDVPNKKLTPCKSWVCKDRKAYSSSSKRSLALKVSPVSTCLWVRRKSKSPMMRRKSPSRHYSPQSRTRVMRSRNQCMAKTAIAVAAAPEQERVDR